MKTYLPEKSVYYDIDETLLLWTFEKTEENAHKAIIVDGVAVLPNEPMIASLKRNKVRGFGIVVWTHSSASWAKKAIRLLKLDDYVDFITHKPCKYYDDMRCDEWMGVWINSKLYARKK